MDKAIQYHGVKTGRFPPSNTNFGRVTRTVYPLRYLLVTGELTAGFQFYGPFNNVAAARRWATANLKEGTSHRIHNMFDVTLNE